MRANLGEPGRLAALREMIVASKAASEERLSKVRVPSLVVMGTKDPDFKDPAAEARHVAEAMGGTFHLIEGAGHYPHAEMPEVSAPHLLRFLGEHKPEVTRGS
ncbi:2-succinyl-6-hydroxy-2,4-cyclohexadiene-1-carboxylate synthase [compost metagenome]